MEIYNIHVIREDLKLFKEKGYFKKLEKIYRRFPETTCDCCGNCCSDSPILTYPEFLFVYSTFDDITKFSLNQKSDIYKNAVREQFYGLIKTGLKCPFLNIDNRCLVHDFSPFACKRWGLQTENDNKKDWAVDHERNILYKQFYADQGINIPDEVINTKTPFCNKVKVIRNPYNFLHTDFEKAIHEMKNMIMFYGKKNGPDYSLSSYLVNILIGEKVFQERIEVIKMLQAGNENAVEEYIDSLPIESVL